MWSLYVQTPHLIARAAIRTGCNGSRACAATGERCVVLDLNDPVRDVFFLAAQFLSYNLGFLVFECQERNCTLQSGPEGEAPFPDADLVRAGEGLECIERVGGRGSGEAEATLAC